MHAVHLQQLLESFGYVQHVTGPTHSAGHTLDLVIARRDTEISDLYVGGMISDIRRDHDVRVLLSKQVDT